MYKFSDFFRRIKNTQDINPDVLPHDELKIFYAAYIKAMEKDGALYRKKIDIKDYTESIKFTALVDFEFPPFRVRYRIVGSRLISLFGKNITGKYVNDVYGKAERESALKAYQLVYKENRPIFSTCKYMTPFRQIGYYRLIVPVQNEEHNVTGAMACLMPLDKKIKIAEQWQNLDDIRYWNEIIES